MDTTLSKDLKVLTFHLIFSSKLKLTEACCTRRLIKKSQPHQSFIHISSFPLLVAAFGWNRSRRPYRCFDLEQVFISLTPFPVKLSLGWPNFTPFYLTRQTYSLSLYITASHQLHNSPNFTLHCYCYIFNQKNGFGGSEFSHHRSNSTLFRRRRGWSSLPWALGKG